jgi:hypothetical protein
MEALERMAIDSMKKTLLSAAKEDGEKGDIGADMLLMVTCFEQVKMPVLRQTFIELLSLAFLDTPKYLAVTRVINKAIAMMAIDCLKDG